jgi:hypothetical protein
VKILMSDFEGREETCIVSFRWGAAVRMRALPGSIRRLRFRRRTRVRRTLLALVQSRAIGSIHGRKLLPLATLKSAIGCKMADAPQDKGRTRSDRRTCASCDVTGRLRFPREHYGRGRRHSRRRNASLILKFEKFDPHAPMMFPRCRPGVIRGVAGMFFRRCECHPLSSPHESILMKVRKCFSLDCA